MKMRKICAATLVLAQLVFGAVLIGRGSTLDRRAEERIQNVIACGQECRFVLDSFFYYENGDQPLDFNLEWSGSADGMYRYYSVVTDEKGHSRIGSSYKTPPEGPYLDSELEYVYRLDAGSVHAAFAEENPDDHWHIPILLGPNEGKFSIGGSARRVYAVGYVYQGQLVFTGIQIGDTVY